MVVKASPKCNGVITRRRETVVGIKESAIDFVIVSQDMAAVVNRMEINKKRDKVLKNF